MGSCAGSTGSTGPCPCWGSYPGKHGHGDSTARSHSQSVQLLSPQTARTRHHSSSPMWDTTASVIFVQRANTRSARNEGVATSGRKYASVIGDARAYRGIPQWNKVHCSHRLGSNVVTSKNQIAHRVPLFHMLGRSEFSTLLNNSV